MILTDYFYPQHDSTWDFAVQCGVKHGVIRLPETEEFDLCSREHWQSLCGRFRDNGISPLIVEPLPNCLHDHIKAGDEKRDESIERFIRMLPIMEEQGINTVCFNFMAHVGWTRTSAVIPERGGALVTGFDLKDYVPSDARISEEELWKNYEYFIRAVIPEAEKHGVRMALHPDDPPLAKLGNVSRIMISAENIKKAISVVDSDMLGVTYCQATYRMMGEDIEKTAEEFGKKIFFVHFRSCRGSKESFMETFHDNGDIDMARMIRLYTRICPDAAIRVDHVPQMATETDGVAGYTALGRLFAIGYLKGLLEANC